MHQSQPLFTKWTHPDNPHQARKQMSLAPQKILPSLFPSLTLAHTNFLNRLLLIFLSTTLSNSEDRNYYGPYFTHKAIKAQKTWSDLPTVTVPGTPERKSLIFPLHHTATLLPSLWFIRHPLWQGNCIKGHWVEESFLTQFFTFLLDPPSCHLHPGLPRDALAPCFRCIWNL